ncbi:xylosidase, partial [Flavobacterium sp. LBUM151]
MKNKVYLVCLLLCLGSLNGIAQSFEKTNLGVKSIINSNVVEIQFYSPEIVRVIKYPAGKSFEKKSLSVVKIAESTKFISNKQGENLSLKSKSIEVVLNLTDGNVSFKTPDSKLLLNEKKAGAIFTDFNDAGAKTYSISQSFILDKKESIYGLGILQNGKMSQRNQKVHMVQNNTWDFVTFFQSDKGYGLFWDNYS